MIPIIRTNYFLLFVFSCILLLSCKQPETVVVTENPTPAAPIPEPRDTAIASAAFRQLNVGETDRIPSLDPLFAENASTMRALQLMYEGLLRLDGDGSVIPAIAKSWSVSSDSLTYRFSLRDDVYYHDSEAFINGTGRKLAAGDVKYVFERMADNDVPEHAAQMFMNIRGFEPYYREQHFVLNPAERQLEGIKGIGIPNDSTVVFRLNSRDPHFLEKLASPYAVVYPREAIGKNGTAFTPVGSGPFALSRKQGNTHYIFARFNNYYNPDIPALNRVDVVVYLQDTSLWKALQEGDIHLVPQVSPLLLDSLVNADGNANSSLRDHFTWKVNPGETYYTINFNPQSSFSRESAGVLAQFADTGFVAEAVPNKLVDFERLGENAGNPSLSDIDTVRTTFASDPYLRNFLNTLADTLQHQGVLLQITEFRTPVENTALYSNLYIPLFAADEWQAGPRSLIRFSVRQSALVHDRIEGLTFNRYPWWLDLRATTLPGIDNLGR